MKNLVQRETTIGRLERNLEVKLKAFLSIAVIVATLTLSGCYSVGSDPKSTLKACELQKELADFSFSAIESGNSSPEFFAESLRRSLVIAQTAEETDALPFEYQSDFLAALVDPNTPADWEPSQEMADATTEIGLICQTYGILF
jgi:hypothetical protein